MATREEARARRRKKRIIASIIRFILLVIIGLVALTVYYVSRINSISGTWERDYDVTDEVATNTVVWLSDIEGEDIDVDWVKSRIGELDVKVILQMNKTGFRKGEYSISVDEASYAECENKTKEILASCMEEIIASKLQEAGYGDTVTTAQSQEAILNVLGCSMQEYLSQNEVSVMYPIENINSEVSESGQYEVDIKTITWMHDGQELSEKYVKNAEVMILPEGEEIYSKRDQ